MTYDEWLAEGARLALKLGELEQAKHAWIVAGVELGHLTRLTGGRPAASTGDTMVNLTRDQRLTQTEDFMRAFFQLARRDTDLTGWIMLKQGCSRQTAEKRVAAVLDQQFPGEIPTVAFRKWLEKYT